MTNILITGASRGIGRAIAMRFARENCNLFVNSLNGGTKLEETVAVLNALRSENHTEGDIVQMRGDVGDPDFVRSMFAHIEDGVDILINNAGISYVGLLQDMTDGDWDRILRTNLSSVHYCCHEAIPQMLKKESGRIVNISSVWGNVGASCEVAYSATKGAINAYTRALAKELAPSHITVNAVACGCVDTDMNKCFSQEEKAVLCEEIPVGRFAEADEVARLVHDLCYQSEYLTGQVITMDGGWQ